jgi:hypothetical protein
MPDYPAVPIPSMVTAPTIIDPMHQFASDAGYTIRRSQWSRPRRRFTLEYLGKTTLEMRQIRDFLQTVRLGALEFTWTHPTAVDVATVINSTPVRIFYQHGLVTGQWIKMTGNPNPSIEGIPLQVTRLDSTQLALNGTSAGGTGTGQVVVYLPHAVGSFSEGTWASPVTLIGPEQLLATVPARRSGYFNFSVTIEETF